MWAYLPDVTQEARLLADAGWGPSWAPTGERIASAFGESGDSEVFSVNLFEIEPVLWPD